MATNPPMISRVSTRSQVLGPDILIKVPTGNTNRPAQHPADSTPQEDSKHWSASGTSRPSREQTDDGRHEGEPILVEFGLSFAPPGPSPVVDVVEE